MPSPAYVIGHISVKDSALWADYRSRVPASLAPFGAELVFRGMRTDILAGVNRHPDTVVIRFPDRDTALAWFRSEAYQALVPLREAAADVDLAVFEAV